jgi:hypothetical protein
MSVVRYSAVVKADALHQVHALQAQGYSRRGAVQQISAQLGCRSETLNAWLRRDATTQRSRATAGHDARVMRLEREVRYLLRINADLRQALERRAGDAGVQADVLPMLRR